MLALVQAKPDLTLVEIQTELRKQRRLEVSIAAVWRYLDKRGLRFKKACTPPSKSGLTSPRRVSSGASASRWSRNASSLSMKPGSPRTWRAAAATNRQALRRDR